MALGGQSGGKKGGRPSGPDLEQRRRNAAAIRPLLHPEPVVTTPSGDIAHGPLHPLHSWRQADLGVRVLQGEAWFNARRAMMLGFREQLDRVHALVALGTPPRDIEATSAALVQAWRHAQNTLPDRGMPLVATLLADELAPRDETAGKKAVMSNYAGRPFRYATWKDAEIEALARLGITDRNAIAEADGMLTPGAYKQRKQRGRRSRKTGDSTH